MAATTDSPFKFPWFNISCRDIMVKQVLYGELLLLSKKIKKCRLRFSGLHLISLGKIVDNLILWIQDQYTRTPFPVLLILLVLFFFFFHSARRMMKYFKVISTEWNKTDLFLSFFFDKKVLAFIWILEIWWSHFIAKWSLDDHVVYGCCIIRQGIFM